MENKDQKNDPAVLFLYCERQKTFKKNKHSASYVTLSNLHFWLFSSF